MPDSASFRIVTIWLSLNFDFRMTTPEPEQSTADCQSTGGAYECARDRFRDDGTPNGQQHDDERLRKTTHSSSFTRRSPGTSCQSRIRPGESMRKSQLECGRVARSVRRAAPECESH